jgi:hypothetical protein
MLWRRKRAPPPPRGVWIAGEFLTLEELCTSVLLTGGIGKGKSICSEIFIKQLILLGCPILACCVKTDEAKRYIRICQELGQSHRLRLIRPDSEYKINLLDYLCKMPGGGPQAAVQFLSRLHDVLLRNEAGKGNEEAFWRTLFESALLAAIDLCLIAEGKVNLEMVSRVLTTSPANRAEVASDAFYQTSYCGKLLKQVDAIGQAPDCAPGLKRRCARAVEVLAGELASVGEKARGAVLSMNNGLTARFLVDPFYDLLSTDTTWTPEAAEAGGFIDVVDFAVLVHGTNARMLNLAFAMLVQMHCVRRDPELIKVPFTLVRDEASFVLHPEWDASIQVVSRSQKLLMIDVIQDFDILLAALGGTPKAKHEAHAFASNHLLKVMFGNTNNEMNEHFSRMLGDRRETTTSGGSGRGEPRGLVDALLGATADFHWEEGNYEPYLRPGEFARLRVGEAVMYLGGRPLGRCGEPFRIVDFWTGGKR